jgi:cation diffusion facilitator family transporter
VNISLRFSRRRPDEQFPFGYEKAEHLATAVTGVVLAVAVTGVFLYQIKDILTLHQGPTHINAVGVAVLSIVVSGALYRRGEHLAHSLGSPALHTTAEHSKADSISSIAVLFGVGAAALDFHLIDRLVAVFEIGHIVILAGEFLLHAARGLVDRSLPEADEALVLAACTEVPGVLGVAQLRTRSGTRMHWVDVVVTVSDELPVSDAHEIVTLAAKAILGSLGPGARPRVSFQSLRPRA